MSKDYLTSKIQSICLSMFRKDFFGIYHGSISAKTDTDQFLINTRSAIFDAIEAQTLIKLYFKKDYRWKEASIDAHIHQQIYLNISDAKFISFTMPPYTTAYSLEHNLITPQDYFGYMEFGNIEIIDPKKFDNWYDRAQSVITHYFQTKNTNIMVIKGYGVYAYHRDLDIMAKKLAILEKSCRLLTLNAR